jgi:hypothetical protein
MDFEYKITCEGVPREKLTAALKGLPSPIARPEMREIYNYRVEADGYYFVDRGVQAITAATAMRHLIDAAFTSGASEVVVTRRAGGKNA